MKKYEIEPYNDAYDDGDFKREEAYIRAKKKLDKIVGFYWHLGVYIVVNLFLIILISSSLDEGESMWSFGPFATPFFWGIGLAFHFLGVFGSGLLFGKNWEERKIKELMDKDKEEVKKYK